MNFFSFAVLLLLPASVSARGCFGGNCIWICQATGNTANPYELVQVEDDGLNPVYPDILPGAVNPTDYPNCVVDDQCNLCCSGNCIGDPHFLTWSGEWYDFHGQCDLVFLNNPTFGNGTGMDLHIRTTIRGGFSFIEVAAVRIGDDVIEISGWGEHLFNGVDYAHLPKKMAGKYEVNRRSDPSHPNVWYYTVQLDEGKVIDIHTFKDLVSVKLNGVSGAEFGKSLGLMGEFGTGRHLARDGKTVLEEPDVFGQEWQVMEGESMLFTAARVPQAPAKCIMPEKKSSTNRRLGESIAEASARNACSHWQENMVEMCVYDVMATGDLEWASAGPM